MKIEMSENQLLVVLAALESEHEAAARAYRHDPTEENKIVLDYLAELYDDLAAYTQ